jgi:uncharacterized protein YjgD (DUF1641 family)
VDTNDKLEFGHLTAAAHDALTDEMVARLSAVAADGMDLMDQINRSGVAKALKAVEQLVANGDLDRLVALARTYGAVQDALTDEMVARIAETVGTSLSLVDRLNRSSAERLVEALERLVASGSLARIDALTAQLVTSLEALERLTGASEAANRAVPGQPPPAGGLRGLWQLLCDRENQETLRFLLACGRGLRQ